ncbi:MAG: hypothetical protein V1882_01440 [Candidatus Omnitrophota bacterium]
MIKKISLLAIGFLICFPLAAFAAVLVEGRTGTLIITNPDGTTITAGPNDPLPVIQDGASVKVMDGVARISTTGTTILQVLAGTLTFQLAPGTILNVMFEPTGAVIAEAMTGQMTTVIADGRTATMDAGDQIRLTPDGGFEAFKGEIILTDSTGKTEILGAGIKIEGYTPPETPDVLTVDTQVQSEETSRDISPVQS